jgi:hypothetical protein
MQPELLEMGNSPAKLDWHNHAPKPFAISPGSSAVSRDLATVHKCEEFLALGLLTNWKNSSTLSKSEEFHRIRGGIPPI